MNLSVLRQIVANFAHFSRLHCVLNRGSWLILMYHRVSAFDKDLEEGMFVTPDTFQKQISWLSKNCDILPLSRLIQDVNSGKNFKRPAIALTFDDGWKDNFDYAYPVLKEHGCPATIFLPTSFTGTRKRFWTDMVPVSELDALKALGRKEREARLSSLGTESEERVFLSWEEVLEMQSAGITFGSHSHSHAYYSELENEEIHADYKTSIKTLEQKGVKPVPCFCYPGGQLSTASQRVLTECGVKSALTISRQSDFSQTPRLYGRVSMNHGIAEDAANLTFHLWTRPWISRKITD